MQSTVLGRGSFATLASFAHGSHVHEDPEEERFPSAVVIFTTDGRWRYQSRDGWLDVDRSVVVLGRAEDSYRCAHDTAVPDDRTIYLSIDETALHELLDGHDDAALLDEPVPLRSSVPLDGPLAARLGALVLHDSRLRLDCVALELLLDLRAARPRRSPRHARAIADARAYLDERYAEPVDLALLSRRAHVSPYHFHRLFREQVGVPPHRYLVERRLDRAAELLRAGMTASEAAGAVGYASAGHFSTAFRRRFGVSPSKFA
jgi:AraC-like DNA-binding protein